MIRPAIFIFEMGNGYHNHEPPIRSNGQESAAFATPTTWVFSDQVADDDDLLREELTRDGLHFSEEGFVIWAELLNTELKKSE